MQKCVAASSHPNFHTQGDPKSWHFRFKISFLRHFKIKALLSIQITWSWSTLSPSSFLTTPIGVCCNALLHRVGEKWSELILNIKRQDTISHCELRIVIGKEELFETCRKLTDNSVVLHCLSLSPQAQKFAMVTSRRRLTYTSRPYRFKPSAKNDY